MKNSAKSSKKFEIVRDMQNPSNYNYSIFDSKIMVKNEFKKSEASNYIIFLKVLEYSFKTLYDLVSGSKAKNNLKHCYNEMKKFAEHNLMIEEFEENVNYAEYRQLVDELQELPAEAYENNIYFDIELTSN